MLFRVVRLGLGLWLAVTAYDWVKTQTSMGTDEFLNTVNQQYARFMAVCQDTESSHKFLRDHNFSLCDKIDREVARVRTFDGGPLAADFRQWQEKHPLSMNGVWGLVDDSRDYVVSSLSQAVASTKERYLQSKKRSAAEIRAEQIALLEDLYRLEKSRIEFRQKIEQQLADFRTHSLATSATS